MIELDGEFKGSNNFPFIILFADSSWRLTSFVQSLKQKHWWFPVFTLIPMPMSLLASIPCKSNPSLIVMLSATPSKHMHSSLQNAESEAHALTRSEKESDTWKTLWHLQFPASCWLWLKMQNAGGNWYWKLPDGCKCLLWFRWKSTIKFKQKKEIEHSEIYLMFWKLRFRVHWNISYIM